MLPDFPFFWFIFYYIRMDLDRIRTESNCITTNKNFNIVLSNKYFYKKNIEADFFITFLELTCLYLDLDFQFYDLIFC
jgi:hypothetical protein